MFSDLEGGGGDRESEPPASRTFIVYLPTPAFFNPAPVPCKFGDSKRSS